MREREERRMTIYFGWHDNSMHDNKQQRQKQVSHGVVAVCERFPLCTQRNGRLSETKQVVTRAPNVSFFSLALWCCETDATRAFSQCQKALWVVNDLSVKREIVKGDERIVRREAKNLFIRPRRTGGTNHQCQRRHCIRYRRPPKASLR